ncbi:MAG TPA: hypothetical protein VFB30_07160 [Spirochaetia bacterium]|nr:hypothetical protein [Spirochaetia bacterium]
MREAPTTDPHAGFPPPLPQTLVAEDSHALAEEAGRLLLSTIDEQLVDKAGCLQEGRFPDALIFSKAVGNPREYRQVADEQGGPGAGIHSHSVVPAFYADLLEAYPAVSLVGEAAAAHPHFRLRGARPRDGNDARGALAQHKLKGGLSRV